MKFFASLLLLAIVALVAVEAYVPKISKPRPNAPNFPGHGPFNPRPSNPRPYHPRLRRSSKDNGQVSVNVDKQGGKTSWGVEAQQKVWGNKHGSVHVSGGASKQPGSKTQGHVGIGGSFKWG